MAPARSACSSVGRELRGEPLAGQIDRIVERGRVAAPQAVQAGFDGPGVVGEGDNLVDIVGEVHQIDAVLAAHQRLDEAPGGVFLELFVGEDALAGVQRQHDLEWCRGLALEDGDGLRASVLGDGKVGCAEPRDGRTLVVGHVEPGGFRP
jgi:hypothetical protein